MVGEKRVERQAREVALESLLGSTNPTMLLPTLSRFEVPR